MVQLVLTGFGTFGQVLDNPTSHLVKSVAASPDALVPGCNLQSSSIIEVSTEDVDAWIADNLVPCLRAADSSTQVLVLHLGVHSQATRILLEQCCYNTATFKIPDVRGRLASGDPISDCLPVGTCCKTGIDLEPVLSKLVELGHEVALSDDPGRYICNWVYFRSLQTAASLGSADRVHVLFVHVPPFELIDEPKQRAFLFDLIQVLQEQLEQSRDADTSSSS